MNVDLTVDDINTLLTSLSYSKRNVRDEPDTPAMVRQANLARLEAVEAKLQRARKSEPKQHDAG
jgi:hypothetical protein